MYSLKNTPIPSSMFLINIKNNFKNTELLITDMSDRCVCYSIFTPAHDKSCFSRPLNAKRAVRITDSHPTRVKKIAGYSTVIKQTVSPEHYDLDVFTTSVNMLFLVPACSTLDRIVI